jgi:23S rRNA pseudouridine1911/1915/1917 synthase
MPPRSFTVARSEQGRSLADVLRARLRMSREEAVRLVQQRRVQLHGSPCLDPARRVHPGQRIEVLAPPPDGATSSRRKTQRGETADRSNKGPRPILRHVDEHIVVVEKPAGLTTMRHAHETAEFGSRARRFLPPTLADLLPQLIAEHQQGKPGRVRAVHRLDKETSGLVVFARTALAERHLGQQFRAHSTERLYRALVRGKARSERIESWLIDDRGDGRRGSSSKPGEGQRAVTHVRVVEELGDYTLVECRLETGRTHQVRIHLGEAGTPLCGETVYDRPLHGAPMPDGSGAPRVALHAATLGFVHPETGQQVRWESPLPADLAGVLERLRAGSDPRP